MGLNISGAFKGAAKGLNQGMDLVSFMNDLQELEYKRGKRAKKDAAQDEFKNFLKGKKYKVDGQSELLIPDSPEEKKAKPFSFVKPAETGEPLSGVDRPTGAEALRKQAELFGDGTAYAKAEEIEKGEAKAIADRDSQQAAIELIHKDLLERSEWINTYGKDLGETAPIHAQRIRGAIALAESGKTTPENLQTRYDDIMSDLADSLEEADKTAKLALSGRKLATLSSGAQQVYNELATLPEKEYKELIEAKGIGEARELSKLEMSPTWKQLPEWEKAIVLKELDRYHGSDISKIFLNSLLREGAGLREAE